MISFKNEKLTAIRHYTLYVIALEKGKYYVGITARKNHLDRIRQHGGPYGAVWTKKYKPLKPYKIIRLEDLGKITTFRAEKREKAVFEEMRKQFGLKNVRGGRVVSSRFVYRLGPMYFNQSMFETLGVALLLIVMALYLSQKK